jgi:hypothetical protein
MSKRASLEEQISILEDNIQDVDIKISNLQSLIDYAEDDTEDRITELRNNELENLENAKRIYEERLEEYEDELADLDDDDE